MIEAAQAPLDPKFEHRPLVGVQINARLLVDQLSQTLEIGIREFFLPSALAQRWSCLGTRPTLCRGTRRLA
jgi:hypothetical protein